MTKLSGDNTSTCEIMRKFKSSYSIGLLCTTWFMSFILLTAAATAICRLMKGQTGIGLAVALYACICLIIVAFIYSYFNQIKQVEVAADKVVIRKVYGAITIPRKEILYARHRKTLTRAIKSWGVYGLFGLTGEFWEDKTGQFTVAVKDTQSLIEIKTSNKCYVISCDRYEEVLKLLEQAE